jgi:hypothetical protein
VLRRLFAVVCDVGMCCGARLPSSVMSAMACAAALVSACAAALVCCRLLSSASSECWRLLSSIRQQRVKLDSENACFTIVMPRSDFCLLLLLLQLRAVARLSH